MNFLLLTHGAGSNRNAPLLVAVANAFSEHGVEVLRYDLAFRQERPKGPPRPGDAARDREGLREQILKLRERNPEQVWLGGHSYGGRQSSMLAAEAPGLADRLLLLSYPLHPPGKPGQLRTAHFPKLHTPVLFVHGSRDPFGSIEEMRSAIQLIPAPVQLMEAEGAGHDLGRDRAALASKIVAAFLGLPKPAGG
jgi:predicted alpha/beta-hydrolase family hydrolase